MVQPEPKERTFQNPIIPGFYPDPSICRVGEAYYLVTSSFAYFPGIPIFHSKDLIHWEQIGHVLNRPSQLNLDGLEHSQGIFAPTIRYHQGLFYLITTNVGNGGNFIVTADNPAGPWSEPYWLKDAPGIDPSLFFDTDGKVYYTGTRPAPEGTKYFGNWEIWLQELDLESMSLVGETYPLWRGALRDVVWPEGPHLYQKDGWYYLMISEGGTDYHHSVTIARSKSITGPYEGNPANPILTHRHLGKSYPIVNTGHADLIETQTGEWWMVLLASRPYGGYFRNMGRETFLAPVIWEDGWPIVSPGTGKVESVYQVPDLPELTFPTKSNRDHFDINQLDLSWIFLRTPHDQFWSLTENPGNLRLKLKPERLTDKVNPSLICRRQQHTHFTVGTIFKFTPHSDNESAGLILIQSNLFHYRFEYGLSANQTIVRIIKCSNGNEEEIAVKPFSAEQIYLKIVAKGQNLNFYYGASENSVKALAHNIDARILSTDVAGGFVGTCIGLYASSHGQASSNYVDFDWFEYLPETS